MLLDNRKGNGPYNFFLLKTGKSHDGCVSRNPRYDKAENRVFLPK